MKLPLAQFKREDFSEVESAWMDKLLRPLNTQLKALGSILNNGLVFGDNVQGFTKEIVTASASATGGWHVVGANGEPPFQNSWAYYGSPYFAPAFTRGSDGVVKIRGSVKSGTMSTAAFTLPVGYRPNQSRGFPVSCGLAAYAIIDSSGAVTIGGDAGVSAAGVSLDVISFPADDASGASSSGLFPVKFKNDLPGGRRPTSVTVVSATDITNNTTSTPVSTWNPAWSTSGDQIVISDVGGLIAGRRYKLLMRVE